ncbi:MAG: cell envelope integrity protein TolA [Candidatus Accumulibacter sp.]|nr:cell envelope integrity protein TolA [Accumulibacter sp.]
MDSYYYPRVPEEKTSVTALVFSLLIHTLFVCALFLGIQWKRQAGGAVMVEVWRPGPPGGGAAGGARLPRDAAAQGKPPEPRPETYREPKHEPLESRQPLKPDIVIKESEKKKGIKKEAEKPLLPERDKPASRMDFSRALNEELRNRQRAAQEREVRQAIEEAFSDQPGGAGTGRGGGWGGGGGGGADTSAYEGRLRGKIRGNVVLPSGISGNPEMTFSVTQLPSGEIVAVRLIQSSGYPPLDEAVERAILKSSPLPRPDNPAHFQRDIKLRYRPFETR